MIEPSPRHSLSVLAVLQCTLSRVRVLACSSLCDGYCVVGGGAPLVCCGGVVSCGVVWCAQFAIQELPNQEVEVTTPSGHKYQGVELDKDLEGVCGLTISSDSKWVPGEGGGARGAVGCGK
jgi:hypothetical protein